MNVFKLDDDDNFFPQITPLIDVFLLVLIFFLVTATYSKIPQKLDVDLPEAAQSDGETATRHRIYITRDGRYKYRDQWIKPDRLTNRLKTIQQTNDRPVLLISADSRSEHQKLVDVIVSAKQAGIQDFGFEIVMNES